MAITDLDRRTTIAYVMNNMGADILGSERAAAYVTAIYQALGAGTPSWPAHRPPASATSRAMNKRRSPALPSAGELAQAPADRQLRVPSRTPRPH
jgi:hypothetical protein